MIDLIARAPDGASGPSDVEAGNSYRTALAVFAFAASLAWGAQDVFARPTPNVAPVASGSPPPVFPTQYAGLRTYYNGAVRELCLVAAADANTGMGAAPMIRKGGVTYAVYLVETTDPDATPVRIRTDLGTKAVRIKT